MLRCLRYLQIFQHKIPRKIPPIDFNYRFSQKFVMFLQGVVALFITESLLAETIHHLLLF